MTAAHRRQDISDRVWGILEPHLPGRAGSWGGKAEDNRRFINAVFWILRTGRPMERLTPRLWWMEQYASSLYKVERQRHLGKVTGKVG